MKTTLLSLLAVTLTGLVFAQTAPQPGSSTVESQPLERWLGDWTFETTTHASPFGADGTNVGACSVLPLRAGPGGEFGDKATGPEENLRRIESDGFDPARGGFFWDSFAGDTAVIDPAYTFDGPRVSMVGTLRAGKKRYLFRSLVTFAEDFQSFTDRREISADGMHWTLLSESRAAKVGSVLAAPDRDLPQAAPPEATSPRTDLATKTQWTPAQQGIVAVFDEWAAAEIAADPIRLMRLLTADFLGGELPSSAPLDRTGVQRLFEGAIAECKIVTCAMPPTSILMEGDTAVACGRYAETRCGNTGARFARSGQWVATLIRRGQQWRILSLFWLEGTPATDKASIKADAGAALETVKTSVWAVRADVPGSRRVDTDSIAYDFAFSFHRILDPLLHPSVTGWAPAPRPCRRLNRVLMGPLRNPRLSFPLPTSSLRTPSRLIAWAGAATDHVAPPSTPRLRSAA